MTASSPDMAAAIVERFGDRVTSDLWLIDIVAATLLASHLNPMASEPDVTTIVANKQIKTAQDSHSDGWVTTCSVPIIWDGNSLSHTVKA